MAWLFLIAAGLCEIGLKLAQNPGQRLFGLALALFCLASNGLLLWLAQKQIVIGTAYAVWTGIGATGTFLVGIWFYGKPPRASCQLKQGTT